MQLDQVAEGVGLAVLPFVDALAPVKPVFLFGRPTLSFGTEAEGLRCGLLAAADLCSQLPDGSLTM